MAISTLYKHDYYSHTQDTRNEREKQRGKWRARSTCVGHAMDEMATIPTNGDRKLVYKIILIDIHCDADVGWVHLEMNYIYPVIVSMRNHMLGMPSTPTKSNLKIIPASCLPMFYNEQMTLNLCDMIGLFELEELSRKNN